MRWAVLARRMTRMVTVRTLQAACWPMACRRRTDPIKGTAPGARLILQIRVGREGKPRRPAGQSGRFVHDTVQDGQGADPQRIRGVSTGNFGMYDSRQGNSTASYTRIATC
jgi:hypothetical protein